MSVINGWNKVYASALDISLQLCAVDSSSIKYPANMRIDFIYIIGFIADEMETWTVCWPSQEVNQHSIKRKTFNFWNGWSGLVI